MKRLKMPDPESLMAKPGEPRMTLAEMTNSAQMLEEIEVGKIVHYVKGGGFCYAAIITGLDLRDANCNRVSLTLFKPDGEERLMASYSDSQAPEHWHWPLDHKVD